MKRFSILSLAVMMVLAFTGDSAMAASKVKWKFTNIQPAGQVYTQYFNQLADNIKKATNGEVDVTNYTAGELPYKGTDLLKVTQKGLVDMAEVVVGFVFGEAPLLALIDYPYVALNREQMKTFQETVLPYLYEELRRLGVEPITWTAYGPRQIVSRKPTQKLEDMKGQKVRTAGGLQDEYIKLWGGVPTFVVWAEVYPAAQRGIVDAIMTATLAIQQSKVYEVCPYFFKIEGPITHAFFCINKKSWESLSAKNQKIVREVATEWKKYWDQKVLMELDEIALQDMVKSGQIKAVAELPMKEKVQTQKALIPILTEYTKKNMQPKGPEAWEKVLKGLNLR